MSALFMFDMFKGDLSQTLVIEEFVKQIDRWSLVRRDTVSYEILNIWKNAIHRKH
jgi:hypothetical protein